MENTTDLFQYTTTYLKNDSHFLNTTLTQIKKGNVQLQLYGYLMPAFGILILILNFAVVISSGLILRAKFQPKTTYLFLGNVAFADLITGVAVLFGHYYPKNDRTQGICELSIGMIVSSSITSIWSVGLIAIDRYLYIAHGIKYKIWMYPTRARILIFATWILGLLVGFLPAMGWSNSIVVGKKTLCWFIILAPKGFVLLTAIIGCLPVIFVIVLYTNILIQAQKKVRQLRKSDKLKKQKQGNLNETNGEMRLYRGGNSQDTANNENKKSMGVSKWKAIKVVVLTTGSFVCTWMPYFISCAIFVLFCSNDTCKNLRFAIASPLAILGCLNSFLNPFIYAWWHNGFRQFVKKFCCGKCNLKKKSNPNQLSLSTSTNTKSSSVKNSSEHSTSKNFDSVEMDSAPKLVKFKSTKM